MSLEVRPGSWLTVIGPTGAGKATLLRAMVGLLPYRGDIVVDGRWVVLARALAQQTPVLLDGRADDRVGPSGLNPRTWGC